MLKITFNKKQSLKATWYRIQNIIWLCQHLLQGITSSKSFCDSYTLYLATMTERLTRPECYNSQNSKKQKQGTNLPSTGIVIQQQGRHQHDGEQPMKMKIKHNYHNAKCIGTSQTDDYSLGLQATLKQHPSPQNIQEYMI